MLDYQRVEEKGPRTPFKKGYSSHVTHLFLAIYRGYNSQLIHWFSAIDKGYNSLYNDRLVAHLAGD